MQTSRFYYSKNWVLGSLTVGMSSDRELSIPEPEYNNELFHNYSTFIKVNSNSRNKLS